MANAQKAFEKRSLYYIEALGRRHSSELVHLDDRIVALALSPVYSTIVFDIERWQGLRDADHAHSFVEPILQLGVFRSTIALRELIEARTDTLLRYANDSLTRRTP